MIVPFRGVYNTHFLTLRNNFNEGYTSNTGLGLWCLMPLSTIFQLYRGKAYDTKHRILEGAIRNS